MRLIKVETQKLQRPTPGPVYEREEYRSTRRKQELARLRDRNEEPLAEIERLRGILRELRAFKKFFPKFVEKQE